MIGLISCSAHKLNRAAPARELYTSALFRKSLAYAEQQCSAIYVASALHGLVSLDQVIEPYDFTVRGMLRGERQLWAGRIARGLVERHGREHYVILAGAEYADPIARELDAFLGLPSPVLEPLRGMQIGERLAWLNAQTRKEAA